MNEQLHVPSINTAIIPVAGYGTRMLPATKAIEKCMLPIGTRPAIDFIVEQCAGAGVENIVFVTSPDSTQLQTYFGENKPLESYLEGKNKTAELERVRGTGRDLHFTYVTQDMSKYGTAVPVWDALENVPVGRKFLVLMGDDFSYRADDGSDLVDLIEATRAGSYEHGMLAATVADEEVHKYGILDVNEASELQGILEKPSPEATPSRFINISKFLLDSEIIQPLLEDYMNTPRSGEYMITDVITEAAQRAPLLVHPIRGTYMDAGSEEGLLHCYDTIVRPKYER